MNGLRRWILTTLFPEVGCAAHRREIIGVQHDEIATTLSGNHAQKVTTCLVRCRGCGECGSYQIAGHWTLEQLRGQEAPAKESVERLLRETGVEPKP